MNFSRRETLALAAAASALGLVGMSTRGAFADDGEQFDVAKLMAPGGTPDHVLGAADAKVTFIEYGSTTCPHCARFHADVFPELKKRYIDTNKIKFIFRPFARDQLDAMVFLLAETAGAKDDAAFYAVLDAYFNTQETWAVSQDPRTALLDIAKQLGFTEESFDAARTNQELLKGIGARRDQAVNDFKLTGTPTFYLNGKMLTGEKTIDELAAEIDPLLS